MRQHLVEDGFRFIRGARCGFGGSDVMRDTMEHAGDALSRFAALVAAQVAPPQDLECVFGKLGFDSGVR
ncbi:MAG: hypothetical protein BWY25_01738 [Chloroflexi bacterium ADurb.Bin222]|nr:MAG: hypothetical protein BWY25_01738 [Chloroflexi bacterium ADurb.Bin222]